MGLLGSPFHGDMLTPTRLLTGRQDDRWRETMAFDAYLFHNSPNRGHDWNHLNRNISLLKDIWYDGMTVWYAILPLCMYTLPCIAKPCIWGDKGHNPCNSITTNIPQTSCWVAADSVSHSLPAMEWLLTAWTSMTTYHDTSQHDKSGMVFEYAK